ncbi:MAG: metallophosphoesterase family protein [Gilvibacter sp.]
MSQYVVGDIHGGLLGLKNVLDKVPFTKDDQFIFLGDYVDGWSDAAATIDFLIAFAKRQPCIFLKGNHDELLQKYLENNDANPMWLASGGATTMQNYTSKSAKDKQEHLAFLHGLQNYYIDQDNKLYVHAGFTNQHGPAHEYYPNLVYWDRTLWEMVCAMDSAIQKGSLNYPKRLALFEEIYIGHTPTTKLNSTLPLQRANVWNIDTGAAFKGPLTVMNTESKAYWQSEPLYSLYPDESGRN